MLVFWLLGKWEEKVAGNLMTEFLSHNLKMFCSYKNTPITLPASSAQSCSIGITGCIHICALLQLTK